jgi:serine/threonine-protein kinase
MTNVVDRLNAALEGRYRIERELGQGGMATVYLAEDVKHSRRVALKVLKPELAAVVGADRFLSEIETTANLQHPHILPLFDSGEADTFLFYVMPYVEGETLRDRLDRERQLPVHEAVGIAVALAGALDHAHRKGIIHRDIKPANILLQDGQPIIADFGIALAVGSAGGARLTETGLSVGTPYYMSPEQATGDQFIGQQSDIYSLTCVFYEMLVGEPPFPGATAQAVLGRIISGEYAPVTRHRASIAPNVDSAIRKGLEKVAADRFSTAAEFGKALQDAGFRYGVLAVPAAGGGGAWRMIAIAAVFAAVLFGGVAATSALRAARATAPVVRFAMELPEGHDPSRPYGANVVISPDGSTIVYAGPASTVGVATQLWFRRMDQLAPVAVNGTDWGINPVFSPDGTQVAFHASSPNGIKIVSLTGAPPMTVATEGVGGNSLAWGEDGYLYTDMPNTGAIGRVPATGGTVEEVLAPNAEAGESFFAWHEVLPNGKLLMTIGYQPDTDVNAYRIAIADLETQERHVIAAGAFARYSRSGHLVYAAADGQLLAATLDIDDGVLGPPVVLTDGVSVGGYGSADLSITDDGTLVYLAGAQTGGLGRAVWVDRSGMVTLIDPEWEFDPGMPEFAMSVSPDGARMALKISTEAGEDIWVKELDDGPLSRLTFDEAIDRRPQWTSDGRRIFYTSDRVSGTGHYDLWVQPSDGTGVPEILLDLEASITEARLTPDESQFVLRLGGLSGAVGVRDLVGLDVGGSETFPVAAEPYDEKGVALSPDGRWIAYESTETGRDEIYVRPFPDAQGGKWQVSTGGGFNPKWAHSGEELFFISANNDMVVAEVGTDGGGIRVGRRQILFNLAQRFIAAQPNYAMWDVAPGDQRFGMLQLGGGTEQERGRLVVVQNFFQVLEERVGR